MRTKNPGVMEALRELKEMNLGKILRAEWDDIQKARADQRAREDYVRDEGRILGRDEGRILGRNEGRQEGEARFAKLTQRLLKENRGEDLLKATEDSSYRDKLFSEYKL